MGIICDWGPAQGSSALISAPLRGTESRQLLIEWRQGSKRSKKVSLLRSHASTLTRSNPPAVCAKRVTLDVDSVSLSPPLVSTTLSSAFEAPPPEDG